MTRSTDTDIVIVGAARTPIGRLMGRLSTLSAPELGSIAIRHALAGSEINPELVDAVIVGHVLSAGVGQNPAKQAALGAGISPRAHTATVNKVCLSGLSALIDATRMLQLGDADVVVAGGMESMSQAPHLLLGSRRGTTYGPLRTLDHMAHDGLTAADLGIAMGELGERHAERYPVTRSEQDELAACSHQRAARATAAGHFAAEIAPVSIAQRGGEDVVHEDEGIRPDCTVDTLARLRPAFSPEGTLTAGNSSQISDGAAAVVLTRRHIAEGKGWTVLAFVKSYGQVAGPDNSLQEQPAHALQTALSAQGWRAGDLDWVEINEAFAAVAVHSAGVLGIEPAVLNPDGGAVSLGHPIGASGARLAVHAAHVLHAGRARRAGVSLCGGGGQGEALLLERA
ncbi:putative acetyl-CoA acetyltransferase [Corynebacterium ciconiae DSM 44920]|uniref:acetyl-CoA C-acyltransferase n=1 Tax=Corynebacterium ciconiae TaxID=227319 RepID=UPI00037BF907|nr:acetyl-CoA C-acyltransferase [Corynebacterium ciconiae]WKD60286.1 putative acetyl-CoA acetyltransferase [Corynebacterium ciconiae DSM 44920]